MAKSDIVQLYNCGNQTLPLQAKQPGGDFYLHEVSIQLQPGKTVRVPKDHLNQAQIGNLCKRGMLKILHDTEVASAR